MDSTLDGKFAEGRIASLEEQFSNLAREAGFDPAAPPTGMKTPRALLARNHRLADWRYLAFGGSLLAASIGVGAWWWSSSVDTAMVAPSAPTPLTQAAAAPKDVAPAAVALSAALEQQLLPLARDLAALRQTVEQLKVRQEQMVRENENLTSQLAAVREEIARSNDSVDQIKATQIQMARESQSLAERLNPSEGQLAGVTASTSEPTALGEEPKMKPEGPRVMPETPLPRPRQPASVAQAQKPAPTGVRQTPVRPQAKKPQPAWPWSAR